MREDHQEALERMFPKGYIITYIQPNTEPAYAWYNPNEDDFIIGYLQMLAEVFLDCEGD